MFSSLEKKSLVSYFDNIEDIKQTLVQPECGKSNNVMIANYTPTVSEDTTNINNCNIILPTTAKAIN
jgi:archaellum component FlaF (FlaF/FlaG flagellin family)